MAQTGNTTPSIVPLMHLEPGSIHKIKQEIISRPDRSSYATLVTLYHEHRTDYLEVPVDARVAVLCDALQHAWDFDEWTVHPISSGGALIACGSAALPMVAGLLDDHRISIATFGSGGEDAIHARSYRKRVCDVAASIASAVLGSPESMPVSLSQREAWLAGVRTKVAAECNKLAFERELTQVAQVQVVVKGPLADSAPVDPSGLMHIKYVELLVAHMSDRSASNWVYERDGIRIAVPRGFISLWVLLKMLDNRYSIASRLYDKHDGQTRLSAKAVFGADELLRDSSGARMDEVREFWQRACGDSYYPFIELPD